MVNTLNTQLWILTRYFEIRRTSKNLLNNHVIFYNDNNLYFCTYRNLKSNIIIENVLHKAHIRIYLYDFSLNLHSSVNTKDKVVESAFKFIFIRCAYTSSFVVKAFTKIRASLYTRLLFGS